MGTGLLVVNGSLDHEVGSLRRMGPGYFPLLLGLGLCFLAIVVLLDDARNTMPERSEPEADGPLRLTHRLRLTVLPLLGILLFALLIRTLGFIPAVLACCTTAGLAHAGNPLHEILLIALIMAVFGSAVFVFGLGVPIRLFVF